MYVGSTYLTYTCFFVFLSGRGRPRVLITEEQVRFLYNESFSAVNIAKHLGCSTSLIYKTLKKMNLHVRARYCNISNEQLAMKISRIHREHPNAGQTV